MLNFYPKNKQTQLGSLFAFTNPTHAYKCKFTNPQKARGKDINNLPTIGNFEMSKFSGNIVSILIQLYSDIL